VDTQLRKPGVTDGEHCDDEKDGISAVAQRDFSVSLAQLGNAAKDQERLREALEMARVLERSGRLAPGDRGMLDAIQRDIDAIP
jgi:hypothetical protein